MFPPGLVKRTERWQTYFSTAPWMCLHVPPRASDKNRDQSAFDNERALPPGPPLCPTERARGEVRGWGWKPATTRKLPSIVVDSWNKGQEGGRGRRGKWQNRKLGPRRFARDRRCSEKGGTHKASEWGGGGGREGNSCRIPAVHPFIHPTRLLPKDFSPQKIPFSHSNVTKDDSRPSPLCAASFVPKRNANRRRIRKYCTF